MFNARTVSFYLRDFSTFFVSILPRVPLPADIQGWPNSCCSVAKLSPPLCDPWTAVCQASFTITLSLLKLMPLSQWYHPTISSYVTLFSSCSQFFLPSGSFPKSQLFTSRGQSTGASASASVLPTNIQGWFPLWLIGLISLHFKGFSRVFSSITIQNLQFFSTQPFLWSISHIHTWLLEKPLLWLDGPLLAKWCLCFLICCLVLSQIFFQGGSIF